MEYFLGSIVSLLAIIVLRVFILKDIGNKRYFNVRFSQSYEHSLISAVSGRRNRMFKSSQSRELEVGERINIFIDNDIAYWIKDHALYRSQFINQKIIKESIERVDTMTMDDVQLKRLMFIIDRLNGVVADDSGDSGDQTI